ncbi:M3 family oligoendopeptidase [Erysipelothrix sp. HDW6A]|uniref:M3 family oligoendopeptidase n=1 Tax=Erysipelothrix sp. HDW6A TaxID=2714928 RepID=UPI00140A7047|nr:M3 family oligoendopeptidase [Erysipelothrix sp. HDW6A]QIK57818.1 M3 family oligoendopeptidase [Erysipelothrix sp. HDW6A]
MYTWSLDALYPAYNEKFDSDINELKKIIRTMDSLSQNLETQADLVKWLETEEAFYTLAMSLSSYISLNLSTDATDAVTNQKLGILQPIMSSTAKPYARFKTFLSKHRDEFPIWVNSNDKIKEYEFMLQEIIDQSSYNLSDDAEEVVSKMKINASNNWSQLQTYLTAMTTIELNGETQTLSSIRNLAYDSDQTVRKAAYEKELELYKPIEESVAFALNSIKGEVNTLSELRGYSSPLEQTLINSRLSQETLDALIAAIEEYLPTFRKFFKHKAKLLGHKDSLPWYDLFAPFETSNPKTYTIEESKEMIVSSFADFSDDLSEMTRTAYENKWIDFLPKEGKSGGAFCSNQPQIKQSYILTNFGGSISDIITLAHELGHAYHGYMIEDLAILNTDYTMPVAETASTFCENIVLNAALKTVSDEEKIVLIENSISDLAQITVDILSRYKFETEVFKRRKEEFLFAKDLKEIMLQAQRDTYGDGLDENAMHPYMWINKGHYYSGELSFYNFPYAFGGLFALGLYHQFEEEGKDFVPKYQALLKATPTASCEDVAKMADIDVTDINFWKSSLDVVAKRIDDFIELTK